MHGKKRTSRADGQGEQSSDTYKAHGGKENLEPLAGWADRSPGSMRAKCNIICYSRASSKKKAFN
jgi:hypothetical protein